MIMACEDHIRLANIIKGVHLKLRLETCKNGEQDAWKSHCSNEEMLQGYASAMKQLATEFWAKNADDLLNEKAKCRVKWIVEQCNIYYFQEGCSGALKRECELITKYKLLSSGCFDFSSFLNQKVDKLHVLDVGSCYNPFSNVPFFDVLSIDLAPGSPDVFQCDFLNVKISSKLLITEKNKVYELPESSFDVVVFSLLLEYFPSPNQRFHCCKKAYELLKPNGILCIVTPDSKHATANSKILKMWRYALADIGFLRLVCDKLPHLHCMIFRKCINPNVSKQWLSRTMESNLRKGQPAIQKYEELMAIPQDFHSYGKDSMTEDTTVNYRRDDDCVVASNFQALPKL